MTKDTHASKIELIPIDRINILNPRVRNKKIFLEIATNMTQVGLKRPITVTPYRSGTLDKDYDLVCGQGRIEAFMACGQSHIPALVIDADEKQALIMSLVENLARRQHRATDLLQGIEILQKQGYKAAEIATKTGLGTEYIKDILNLLARGEERLIAAVDAGHMPLSLAIKVAESPEAEQRALHEAYETKQLRGGRLLMVKKLFERRRRIGKTFKSGARTNSRKFNHVTTADDVLKVYQREVDRKRLLARKADVVANRMMFITEALRQLLAEEHFNTLLRAEGLTTLPKPLVALIAARGTFHG